MGNNILSAGQSNEQTNHKYLENLQYIMQTKTPAFGFVKIFRMKQKPYQYVMCKTYSAMPDDPSIKNRKQKYKNVPQNKNIISIDTVDFKTVRQTCGRHMNLSVYCRYYFYTLEQAISKKMKKMSKFPEQQVLYIIKTLISLYESFHQSEQKQFGIFKASNIFLTPQGFLKIYPWIRQWREQQTEENLFLKNNLFNFYNENEVELNLSKNKKDMKKSFQENDIQDIGIILLCVICLAKQSDYRTLGEDIKYEIVKFVINSYNQPQNKNLFLFRNLLKGIFENKWQITQIKNQIQYLVKTHDFKNSIRIKIVTNENQDSDSTINGQGLQKQRQSRLQMMPKSQLVPGRIRCYSSKISSSVNSD